MPRQGHARCLCIVNIGQQPAEIWLGSELNGKETDAWVRGMAVDCEGGIGIAQGRFVARSIHGTSLTFFWSDYQYIISLVLLITVFFLR